MALVEPRLNEEPGLRNLTRTLAEWISDLRYDDLTQSACAWSKHAMLDWAGVALAASRDPLVEIIAEELAATANGRCTLVGRGQKVDMHTAALINGAASHALDYDDVAAAMHGHPTVPVAPAILALGEELDASGKDIITAFVAGVQTECRLGAMTDSSAREESTHYEQGFHATGTLGAFGAAAAAANLMRLDAASTARALGLAASQGAGLKCNFGTMTKPFHAGKAAANGLLASRLAARGFTARDNAIEAPQGFAFAQIPEFTPKAPEPASDGVFEVERILFKYHAACYSTHASLNALQALRSEYDIKLEDVERISLSVNTRHANNCDNADPRTGLDLKFSIRHLAVLALDGIDTAALETYNSDNATNPRYVAVRERTHVAFEPNRNRMTADVRVILKDGRTLTQFSDSGKPASDINRQWQRLSAKFAALATPVIGEERANRAIVTFSELDAAKSCRDVVSAVS